MVTNRWVTQPQDAVEHGLSKGVPPLPSLEVVYLTDPDRWPQVLPPPLTPPEQPRVHVRITDIDLRFGDFRYKELVGLLRRRRRARRRARRVPAADPDRSGVAPSRSAASGSASPRSWPSSS